MHYCYNIELHDVVCMYRWHNYNETQMSMPFRGDIEMYWEASSHATQDKYH